MVMSVRRSDPQLPPLKVLVTGFYDWVDVNGLPAGTSNTTEVNPSGRLVDGPHLKAQLAKVQTLTSGRSIEWSFKTLRVVRHEAKSAGFENYDIVISLGLYEDLPKNHLRLEVDAINKFESLDVDEGTRLLQQATSAEGHVNTSLRLIALIQESIQQALTQARKQAASVSFQPRQADAARERSAHLLDLSELVGSARLRTVFALPGVSAFRSDRFDEAKALGAEEACAKAGAELSQAVSNYFRKRLAAASTLRTKNLLHQEGQGLFGGAPSFEDQSHRRVVVQAEKTLADVVFSLRSAESNCYIGKALIQMDASSRCVSESRDLGAILKTPPPSLNTQRKYGAYELVKNVNDEKTVNTYVCNATHYHALELVSNRSLLNIRLSAAYFVHLPSTENKDMPTLARGVAALIEDLIE